MCSTKNINDQLGKYPERIKWETTSDQSQKAILRLETLLKTSIKAWSFRRHTIEY